MVYNLMFLMYIYIVKCICEVMSNSLITAIKLINITSHSYIFSSIIDTVSLLCRVKSYFQAPKLMANMECWHIPQSGECLLRTGGARNYYSCSRRVPPSPFPADFHRAPRPAPRPTLPESFFSMFYDPSLPTKGKVCESWVPL